MCIRDRADCICRYHLYMDRSRLGVVEAPRLVVIHPTSEREKLEGRLIGMKRTFLAVAIWIAALGAPVLASAQVGSTTEIITGKVTGPQGEPIAGARVEVMSIETQITRGRTTNEKGQYVLLFPDGGGQYRVTVKAIGFAQNVSTVLRQADEDRLEHDLSLIHISEPTRLGMISYAV